MKKKYTFYPLLFLCLTMSLHTIAQVKLKGNKIVIIEDRDISDFSKIEIDDKIDVIITQGNRQNVTVETDENLQEAISTEVKGDILQISLSKKIIKKKVLLVTITIADAIDEITVKDRADVKGDNTLTFDNLTLNTLGNSKANLSVKATIFTMNNTESANVTLSVDAEDSYINANNSGRSKIYLTADNLELLAQGSSTTEVSGSISELLVNAENKSNVKAGLLECDDALIFTSDNADAHIHAKNTFNLTATNASEIFIYGDPKITVDNFSDKAILRKK